TRFSSLAGEVVLVDFMPVETLDALVSLDAEKEHQVRRDSSHCLVRRLTCSHGQLTVRMLLKATPHYAAVSTHVALARASTGAVISGGQQHAGLFIGGSVHNPSFSLRVEAGEDATCPLLVAQCTLTKGEELFFVLGVADSAQAVRQLVELDWPARDF